MARATALFPLIVMVHLAAFSQAAPLTFDDAKRQAIAKNFDLMALRHQLDESRAVTARTRSSLYPRLGVAAGFDSEVASRITRGSPVAYAYANYALFRGFEDSYRWNIADADRNRSEIALQQAEFQLALQVEKEFNQALFHQESLVFVEQALKANELHRKLAQQRRSGGLTAESDVMDFELREALLRSESTSLAHEIERSRLNLVRLLGENETKEIEPTGKMHHHHVVGTLDEYLGLLDKSGATVVTATQDLAKATAESDLWRSRWYPTISVETQAGYLPLEQRPAAGGASVRGLLLARFDLFSGFDTLAERRAAESKRARFEALRQQALLTSRNQLRIIYGEMEAIHARLHLEARNEERARKYYDAVLREYRRGIKNSADVRSAAEGLHEAALRRLRFKHEALVQRLEFEKILGQPARIEITQD